MAVRDIFHRNKLDLFKLWLGDRALPPVGKWEVCRWKGASGQPMRIIFDNTKSSEHLSCNEAAYKDVSAFIKERKISDECGTQPTISQQAIPAEALREIAAMAGEVEHINERINCCLSQLNNINRRLRQLLVSP